LGREVPLRKVLRRTCSGHTDVVLERLHGWQAQDQGSMAMEVHL